MKPVVIDKKCGAGKDICTAIKACPEGAISYIEVDEPLYDREVDCNLPSREEAPDTDG